MSLTPLNLNGPLPTAPLAQAATHHPGKPGRTPRYNGEDHSRPQGDDRNHDYEADPPHSQLPDWVNAAVAVVMRVGFPMAVAAVFIWFFLFRQEAALQSHIAHTQQATQDTAQMLRALTTAAEAQADVARRALQLQLVACYKVARSAQDRIECSAAVR